MTVVSLGLIQLLIENANTIGSVPDHLLDIQPQFSRSEDDLDVSQDCDFLSKKRNRKKRNSLNGKRRYTLDIVFLSWNNIKHCIRSTPWSAQNG